MDESMMMSESCITLTSLNETPTYPLAQSSFSDHVEKEDIASAVLTESLVWSVRMFLKLTIIMLKIMLLKKILKRKLILKVQKTF